MTRNKKIFGGCVAIVFVLFLFAYLGLGALILIAAVLFIYGVWYLLTSKKLQPMSREDKHRLDEDLANIDVTLDSITESAEKTDFGEGSSGGGGSSGNW